MLNEDIEQEMVERAICRAAIHELYDKGKGDYPLLNEKVYFCS